MFYHIYTDRSNVSIEDIILMAESQLQVSYDRYSIVYIKASNLVAFPSLISDIDKLLIVGRSEGKLVILHNDLSVKSINETLKEKVSPIYHQTLKYVNQTLKTNAIAV